MTTRVGRKTRNNSVATLALFGVGVILAPTWARADPLGAGGGAIYVLSSKAEYQEGCFPPCLCPIMIEQPITGTFKLVYAGATNTGLHSYAVEDVNWTVPFFDPPLRITGTGKYTIGSPGPITLMQQRMELDLYVGANPIEHFDSGWVPVGDMTRINVTVSINGMFCYDRVIAIDADPADGQVTPYMLAKGATYVHGCCSPSSPCDCLCMGPVPMVGDFALVPLSDNGLFRDFAVVNINWQVHLPDAQQTVPIRGFGRYRVGGEFAVQHQLSLELWLGNTGPTHFDSGFVAGGGQFPVIDIFASMNAMDRTACTDTILHVLGEPAVGNAICGGIGGLPCPKGFFCKLPDGACCCDFMGVCAPMPTGCPDVWDPVCGCDGVTYGNECEADATGVTIAHRGECGQQCGGIAGLPCPDGQFCKLPDGQCCCDFFGICTPLPGPCTEEYNPVCGCDGVTYSNECYANAAGVSIDYRGECKSGPCSRMPADLPQAACSECPVGDCGSCGGGTCDDGRITLCEVIGYVCSWIRGCNDDLSGMTRAAYLWRNGECYCWDDGEKRWASTACPAPESGCCPANDGGTAADDSHSPIEVPATITVLRRKGERAWTIPVTIKPPSGTSAVALEIKLSADWVVTAISDGGAWDDVHRKIKWGPFFDDFARKVTFQVRPAVDPGGGNPLRGGQRFRGATGTVSFDGVNHAITVR